MTLWFVMKLLTSVVNQEAKVNTVGTHHTCPEMIHITGIDECNSIH